MTDDVVHAEADPPPHLLDISTEVLQVTLTNCSHVELARIVSTCRDFQKAIQDLRASCTSVSHSDLGLPQLFAEGVQDCWLGRLRQLNGSLDAGASLTAQSLLPGLLSPLRQLRELQLPNLAAADGWRDAAPAIARCAPSLQLLDLSGTTIGSAEVESFQALRALQCLDLTCCPMVSYASVLHLRCACPNLKLIRRQPAWLDGHFETPWGELHTYYPCGAFHFSRARESKGWTAQIRNRGMSGGLCVMEDRLLYIDGEEPSPLDGHIGVLITRARQPEGHVLVVQSMSRPEPPGLSSLASLLLINRPAPGESDRIGGEDGIMASCMRVRPLEPGVTAPPEGLQAELQEFCARKHRAQSAIEVLVRRRAERNALISMEQNTLGSLARAFAVTGSLDRSMRMTLLEEVESRLVGSSSSFAAIVE